MAGYSNNMSILLDKIKSNLGLIMLCKHLPEEFGMDAWAEIIKNHSIVTFSRYYPKKIPFFVTDDTAPEKDGWRYIDENYIGNQQLLGAGDLDWSNLTGNQLLSVSQQLGYGLPDIGSGNFSVEDIQNMAIRTNFSSLFCNQIIPVFRYPNQLQLQAVGQKPVRLSRYMINLYVKHSDDLVTISPTAMETFEQLAQADVAGFLSRNLKYFDGLQTTFVNIDLKLGELESEASKRDGIVDKLENSYVSAGNDAIPYIITV